MLLRRRLLIGLAAGALAAGLGLGIARLPRAAAQPGASVAYFGLSKNFRGPVDPGAVMEHRCRVEDTDVRMLQESAALVLEVSSNAPCDELRRPFNGRMTARWQILLRRAAIPFGTHEGKWQMKDTLGNVAEGTMEGTIGCGTHRPPNLGSCERCRQSLHFEGVLTGRVVSGPLFDKYGERVAVKASYAGQLRGQWPRITAAAGSIDGVSIFPCPQ